MKVKYLIMEYLTEEPRAFLHPLMENHADVAQRLEAKDNQFIAPLKVVSAGEADVVNGRFYATHGSVTLRIKRDPVREELDQHLLNSQFKS